MANPAWVKGKSGNPNGRPKKGNAFTEVLEAILAEKIIEYRGKKISGKEAAARKLLDMALHGDVQALRYLADRIDGTPRQSVSMSGEDGGPLEVFIRYVD